MNHQNLDSLKLERVTFNQFFLYQIGTAVLGVDRSIGTFFA